MAQKRILSPEQDMAANPTENVWVQANAGTGKTSVLVQRLLRILFRTDMTAGNGILCLTYTNAGAGEMRNRILDALQNWAMASDDDLAQLLYGVAMNPTPTASDLAHAREIFFTYIDNPELLKIKTIHGFCEEVLHRFPIEAGLAPSWSLISDSAQKVLLQESFNRLINSSLKDVENGARVNDAFSHIVGRVSETYLDDLLGILTDQYKHFFMVNDIDKYRKYFIDTTQYFLNTNSDVSGDVMPDTLQKIREMAINDQNSLKKPVKYLENIINLTGQYIDKTINFDEYKHAYLTAAGTKIKDVTKKDYLAAEQERVYNQNQANENTQILNDTIALFDISAAFAHMYMEIKRKRNVLDFDDLILYTRKLFSSPEMMGWVLSQLDLSLDYILVDEAQDTSPLQWDILRMLSGDFLTDGGTGDNPRSLFVVGDTKQSIYGFQGADPAAFAISRADIQRQIQNNLRTIREIPLTQSFRSTAPILNTVDTFFDNQSVRELTGFVNNRHVCFRTDARGMVELHKLVAKKESDNDADDYINMIADKIQSLISNNECAAGDIMVLVQNRHPMVAPLVKALKQRSIDVAGSDRIILPNFPAVRDMLNLVRFCINTADDYSLCCVLKSPICRLTDADIFKLCTMRNDINNRRKSESENATDITIFEILGDVFPDAYNIISGAVQNAATMSPYTFFTTLLNSNGIRESMIAALGTQIIDPVEEFLTICLAYERTQPGTLRHFIKWFITGDSEIKRDMDKSSGVRIATVHGSKGLESPVVFLIDTIRTPKGEQVIPIPTNELPAHLRGAADMPRPWIWTPRADQSARRAVASDAASQIRIAEYYRLLYVAMTRARDRLYIYGFTPNKNPPEIAWHTQLWNVLGEYESAHVSDDVIRITNYDE